MEKILVSLVSEQTIPNIEFIREMALEVDYFLFISTKKMEKNGQRKWILKTTKIQDSKILETIVVEEFSFEDIEEKLINTVKEEYFYIVNLTGGTKIMSLAVYDYFRTMNSEIYYLPGNKNKIKIHPGRKKISTDLNSTIDLEDYLSAYGFDIIKKGSPLKSFEASKALLYYFLKENDTKNTGNDFFTLLRQGRKNGLREVNKYESLTSFLDVINFRMDNDNTLSKYECKYLSGEWMEEYLYLLIKNELYFENKLIGLGTEIRGADGSSNEFDVLIMKNNKLYLYECKTSIYDEEGKTFIAETIYKADALRKKFGLFTETTIVTLSDLDDSKLKHHISRAEGNNVKLIGKRSFQNESILKELNL